MINNIYAIFDLKAKLFNQPFFMINDDIAIRMCRMLANDPTSQIAMNPEDYVLYKLGKYDDNSGEMIASQENHQVITKIILLVSDQEKEKIANLKSKLPQQSQQPQKETEV